MIAANAMIENFISNTTSLTRLRVPSCLQIQDVVKPD
jgi:hypothetical protein